MSGQILVGSIKETFQTIGNYVLAATENKIMVIFAGRGMNTLRTIL